MGNEHQKKNQGPPQPQQSASDKMFDNIFEFKMMSKQFGKEAKKSEANHKKLLNKVKDCIAKGNYEQAKVAASDAIRSKNEAKRYTVLSSKIETISQRLQSAYNTQRLTENMKSLTDKMVHAAGIMDMVQINETMANFEKMFDDVDVNANMMDQVMDNVNAGTVNDVEVNNLINQVAEANGMKVADDLDIEAGQQVPQQQIQQQVGQQPVNAEFFP
jgi:charged multivesicular body protein 1